MRGSAEEGQSVPLLHCRGSLRFTALAGLLASVTNVAFASAPERAAMIAFLYKLPTFVEWPDGVLTSPSDAFRLCIVGEDPFGPPLDEAGKGQAVGKQAIVIQREKTVSPDEHCQMMYIGGEPEFVTQSLAAVSGRPVLTVTNTPTGDKGIVNFVAVQDHVHLEIDQQAAVRNHLNVSSKLLDLAAAPEGVAP
jgi:hypothetical protein